MESLGAEDVDADVVDVDVEARRTDATLTSSATDSCEFALRSSTSSNRSLRLSFDDETLLRGCTLPRMLRGFGRHLVSAHVPEAERAQLLKESRAVRRLDAFVSHSWRDSGVSKLVCMLLYCNGALAAAVSIAASAAACALSVAGVLPMWKAYFLYAPWPTVIGCPLFFSTVAFLHHAPGWLGGGRGSSYFLDKLCIDQSDPVRQRAGIECIAAFVAASDRVVVMWSPTYFTRLWCTVEIATFLHAQSRLPGGLSQRNLRRSLIFRPLQLSSLTGVVMIFNQVQVMMTIPWYFFADESGGEYYGSVVLPALTYFAACLGFLHKVRSYVRDSENLDTQLAKFRIEEAKCSDESDRDTIYATVCELYGSLGAFNALVQGSFREAVLAGLPSKSGMPFSVVLFSLMPLVFNALDWTAHNVQLYWDEWLPMASHTAYAFSVLPTSWLMIDLICRLLNTRRAKGMWQPHPVRNMVVSLALSVPVMAVFYAVFGLSQAMRWLHPAFGVAQMLLTCALITANEACFRQAHPSDGAAPAGDGAAAPYH